MSEYEKLDLENVKEFSAKYPEALNYSDLLSMEEPSYIANYEFYGNGKSIIGVSPEGNFNIYGDSKRDLSKSLDYIMNLRPDRPKMIIGDSRLEGIIRNKNLKIKKYNPWYCMSFRPTVLKSVDYVSELSEVHQNDVNEWYQKFNEAEGSSWETPNIKKLGQKKLYGRFRNDQFVGGCANTLINSERLWIGRLYILGAHRRNGHAHALMDFIENEAKESNRSVHLLVNVSNLNAINFYKSRGYSSYGINAYWVFEN